MFFFDSEQWESYSELLEKYKDRTQIIRTASSGFTEVIALITTDMHEIKLGDRVIQKKQATSLLLQKSKAILSLSEQ